MSSADEAIFPPDPLSQTDPSLRPPPFPSAIAAARVKFAATGICPMCGYDSNGRPVIGQHGEDCPVDPGWKIEWLRFPLGMASRDNRDELIPNSPHGVTVQHVIEDWNAIVAGTRWPAWTQGGVTIEGSLDVRIEHCYKLMELAYGERT